MVLLISLHLGMWTDTISADSSLQLHRAIVQHCIVCKGIAPNFTVVSGPGGNGIASIIGLGPVKRDAERCTIGTTRHAWIRSLIIYTVLLKNY